MAEKGTMTTVLQVISCLLVGLNILACSQDELDAAQNHPSSEAIQQSSQKYSGIDLEEPDGDLIREVIGRTSEPQRAVLEDGNLTIAEFEELGLAEGQCLIDAGLGLDRSLVRLNGVAQFSYTIDLGQEFSQADRDAISRCSAEFTREVRIVWVGMTAPIVEHVAKEFRRWTAGCLAERGLNVAAQPWASGDPSQQRVAGECTRAAQERFDTGNFSFGFEGDGRGP